MKLTTTFDLLKKAGACEDGYKKLAKFLGGITKYGRTTPINLLTILDANGVDDCLWALRATQQECESLCRLMAADFAESVLPIFEREHPEDNRPRKAIEAARAFSRGEIGAAARDAAWGAARDAAWAAAWAATGAAAGAAAWAAAWAAARDAAGAAAGAAARAAAWGAAGAAQSEIIRSYLQIEQGSEVAA